METIKVILNPYSGRGRGGQRRQEISAAFARAGLTCDIEETRHVGHGIELAKAAREAGYTVIAAAGGDGTVSEVMNGIARATPHGETVGTLALVPTGSANDFADEMDSPRDLDTAVAMIGAGKTRRLDLGYVEIGDGERSRFFNNNMGMGLEARVTIESYKIKRLQGKALYLTAALRALPRYSAPHIDVTFALENGDTWRRAEQTLLISVGNTRRTGGFYITPDARPDDGLFDVGIAAAIPLWRMAILMPKVMLGKHTGDAAVTMLRCRSLHARCEVGLPIQLDGEVMDESAQEIKVELLHRRLEIIV